MRNCLALVALVGCLLLASPARACDGYAGAGLYGWDIGRLYNSLEFRVPYFAAHPPVYYSYPVPRTYGHSPFAYPPHFRTPDVYGDVVPLEISNPYVPQTDEKPKAEEVKDATVRRPAAEAGSPLMVVNPFVVDDSLVRVGR